MLDASTFSMRVNPSTDSAQNAYQIFLEALVLFIAGAVGMLLPLLALSSGSARGATFITYGNAFAGGVMLSAGIVHMLSDSISGYSGGPRLPLILCLTGIMIPFALEKGGLILFLLQHTQAKPSGESSATRVSGHGLLEISGNQPTYQSTTASTSSQGSPRTRRQSSPRHHSQEYPRNPCVMPAVAAAHLQVKLDFLREASSHSLDVVDHAPTVVPKTANHNEMLTEEDEMFGETHDDAIRTTRHTHFSTSWVLLTVILVFHSVLAGFTLGVQSPNGTPALFLALLLHKVFESVAMGVASTQAANATTFIRQTQFLTYCLAAPIGVVLGRALYESSDAPSESARAMITALTSGSFIYISLVEITQEEFMDEKHRIKKFFAFVLGALLMLALV